MQTKIQRTYKIGEQVKLRHMPHLENKYFDKRQFDYYTDEMLSDANESKQFVIISKVKDKWYKIKDASHEYGSSWYARYNWITPVEVEEGPFAKIIWNAITYLQNYEGYNQDRQGENYSSQFTCDCLEHACEFMLNKTTTFLMWIMKM